MLLLFFITVIMFGHEYNISCFMSVFCFFLSYTGECIIHDKKLNTVAENGASLTGNCYMLLSGQNAFLC